MTDDETDADWIIDNPKFTASCPHCDRTETVDSELSARAWITGHIREEHGDQLPSYE